MFEFSATASIAAHGLTLADLMEAVRFVLDMGLHVVGIASAVAALTPTPRDGGGALGRLYRLIDILALNVGFAKDRPANGLRLRLPR
ncbi:hypothetical protein [Parvibaculum sp.]|uniref:hypothetical protein n=1 Tax=Parvibaculum sp. TaxID=2024848 RepID=UPI002CE8A0A7|nr:hypothetical protein [Parvibaculum sp.]HUD52566.1 hypothetical protein [Parvibaculum sp.]